MGVLYYLGSFIVIVSIFYWAYKVTDRLIKLMRMTYTTLYAVLRVSGIKQKDAEELMKAAEKDWKDESAGV